MRIKKIELEDLSDIGLAYTTDGFTSSLIGAYISLLKYKKLSELEEDDFLICQKEKSQYIFRIKRFENNRVFVVGVKYLISREDAALIVKSMLKKNKKLKFISKAMALAIEMYHQGYPVNVDFDPEEFGYPPEEGEADSNLKKCLESILEQMILDLFSIRYLFSRNNIFLPDNFEASLDVINELGKDADIEAIRKKLLEWKENLKLEEEFEDLDIFVKMLPKKKYTAIITNVREVKE